MGNMIDELSLRKLIQDFYDSPCGNSWLKYKGELYSLDVGYAFEGIYLILRLIEKEFGIEIIPEQYRSENDLENLLIK